MHHRCRNYRKYWLITCRIAMLMLDLKRAEERANAEGWIDADDLERELGVLD